MRWFWWMVPFLLLAAQPAAARPRDDAIAAAFHCSVIADSHQWLDCYYGAAQPVRTALGLAPALAAQVRLAASPPAGGAPRDEAVRDDVMSAAANCIRAAGDRAWLDCYYAAATPMRAALGLSVPAQGAQRAAAACTDAAYRFRRAAAAPPYRPVRRPCRAPAACSPACSARPSRWRAPFPCSPFTSTAAAALPSPWRTAKSGSRSKDDDVDHPAHWRKQPSQMLVTVTPAVMRTFAMTVSGEYGLL